LKICFERLKETKPFLETEAEALRKFLPTYITADPTPAVTAILQVYTDYVRSVMSHVRLVENHVTTGRPTDIKNFMSKFLCKY
jgi:hypothetical protein